jgi:hypothetical protein
MERKMFTIRKSAIALIAATAIALTSFGAAPANAGYRHGDAAAAAAIAGVFGTVAAIIAAKAARDRYRAAYGPYYAAPYGYGVAPHYGYYGGPRWHGWHRRHWYR